MRGLRVFVRPVEASDEGAVTEFLSRHRGGESPENGALTPQWGLLGKILGDIVAVVTLELPDGDELRVVDVTVARDLRRKWIGRVMMREVEQLAMKMDRRRIVVEQAGEAREFFRRVGFQREGEGERWTRVI